jgi:hypothetical protein
MSPSPAQEAAERDVEAAKASGSTSSAASGPPPTPSPDDGNGAPDGGNVTPGKERAAVEAAGRGDDLTPEDERYAVQWYLDPKIVEDEEPTILRLNINIAGPDQPKRKVQWILRGVDRDRIKQIRRDSRNPRTNEEDEMLVNLKLAVEGTVFPDLTDPEVRGQFVDPADALRLRLLRKKPGLIDQLANKVMAISGYDDDDVEEVEAGKS